MEQMPATIIKDSIEGLPKDVKFLAGEIATFKESLCGITGKINESSDKTLRASVWYFKGSLILSAIIALNAFIQIFK